MCRLEVTRFYFQCGHICRYTFPFPNPYCRENKHSAYFEYKESCPGCQGDGRGTVQETFTCDGFTAKVTATYTVGSNLEQFDVPTLRNRRREFLKEINAIEICNWKVETQEMLRDEFVKGVHPRERTFFIGEHVPGFPEVLFRPVPAYLIAGGRNCGVCKKPRQGGIFSSPDGLCPHRADEPHELPCECGDIFSLGCLETHFATGTNACPGCGFEFKILRDSDIPVTTEEGMLSEAVKAIL